MKPGFAIAAIAIPLGAAVSVIGTIYMLNRSLRTDPTPVAASPHVKIHIEPPANLASPDSEATAAVDPQELTTGTVKDLGEPCGFGIALDQGGLIIPSNLVNELSIPGIRLQFSYAKEDIIDHCDAADTYQLAHVTKIGTLP